MTGWIIQFQWSEKHNLWFTIAPDSNDKWSGGVYHTHMVYPFKSQALEIADLLPKMSGTVSRVIPVEINSNEEGIDDVFLAA